MKKVILLPAILSFLFSAGAIAGDQDTVWTTYNGGGGGAYFTNNDSTILVSMQGRYRDLDVKTGEILRESERFEADFGRFELSQDHKYLVSINNGQSNVKIVRYNDFSLLKEYKYDLSERFLKTIAISHDNTIIALASKATDNIIEFININNDEILKEINLKTKRTNYLKFSPDGQYIVLASAIMDYNEEFTHYLDIYDAHTYEHIKTLDILNNGGEYKNIKFSMDGKFLYAPVHGEGSRIFDMETLRKWIQLPGETIEQIMISHIRMASNQKFLIFSLTSMDPYHGHDLQIYSLESGEIVKKYKVTGNGYLTLSKDENRIYAGGNRMYMIETDWNFTTVSDKESLIEAEVEYNNEMLLIDFESIIPEAAEIILYDNSGKMIKLIYFGISHEGMNHIEESIDLVSGVYHLQVKTGNNEVVKKFLVVR